VTFDGRTRDHTKAAGAGRAHPVPVGGFTGQTPNVTPEQLTGLVSRGDLHHALLDSPATNGMVTSDYPSYAA